MLMYYVCISVFSVVLCEVNQGKGQIYYSLHSVYPSSLYNSYIFIFLDIHAKYIYCYCVDEGKRALRK